MLGSALARIAIANGVDVLLIANPASSRLGYLERTLCIDRGGGNTGVSEDANNCANKSENEGVTGGATKGANRDADSGGNTGVNEGAAEGINSGGTKGINSSGTKATNSGTNSASTKVTNIGANSASTKATNRGANLCLCPMDEYGKLAKSILDKTCNRTLFQQQCDALVHFAWQGTYGNLRSDIDLQKRNIRNSNDAVQLAHALGCECFIGVGSQAEYGILDAPFTAETPCNPITEYGKAKLKACAQTHKLAQELSMRHIWVRLGSAYGPRDNLRTCMMQAIAHALQNEPFLCTPGGQLWDYIYCEDAARAIFAMLKGGKDGSIYPLGSGNTRPLKEYISLACKKANPSFRPDFAALEYPPEQVMYLCADISQLKKDTGFKPEVNFEDGIVLTIKWFCQNICQPQSKSQPF